MVDRLLAEAGTDKSRILMAQIFLADIADIGAMNEVWDAWIPAGNTPPRATVQAAMAKQGYKIEIVVHGRGLRRAARFQKPLLQHHLVGVAPHREAADEAVAQQHEGHGLLRDDGVDVVDLDVAHPHRVELQRDSPARTPLAVFMRTGWPLLKSSPMRCASAADMAMVVAPVSSMKLTRCGR